MPPMSLPTFVVIGAMKAGTTSLYHYLRAHPHVFMPRVKELDFFMEEANWSRGLRWYERRFKGAPDGTIALGEASTNYSKYPQYPGVPERMAGVLPDAKLIYVVRHPVDRIWSHYRHRVAVGSERRPLAEAVLTDPTYVDASRYAMQARRFLEHFDRDRLLILTSEALRDQRADAIAQVYRFIGVDPAFTASVHQHEFYRTAARVKHSPVTWRLRTAIKRHFPAAKEAKELVDSMRGALRSVGRRETPRTLEVGDPGMPDEVRAALAERLVGDVVELRALIGGRVDAWGLTPRAMRSTDGRAKDGKGGAHVPTAARRDDGEEDLDPVDLRA